MLQYIHEGHQGKERCLLRARNTVFWPKMTYNIQQLIEKCIICQEYGKSQPIRHYPGTTSFPMAHIGDRHVLLEKNGLSDSGRCILKIHHSEEIAKFHLSRCVHRAITIETDNSQENTSSNTVQPPLPRLDLPEPDFFRKQGGKPCRTIVYR